MPGGRQEGERVVQQLVVVCVRARGEGGDAAAEAACMMRGLWQGCNVAHLHVGCGGCSVCVSSMEDRLSRFVPSLPA